MQPALENTVVILPVCTYVDSLDGAQRERDLLDNIRHIREYLPSNKILVIDNGVKPVNLVGNNIEYIYQPELYNKRKTTGELQMLRYAANRLPSDTIVLKMHGRCKVWNFGALLKFLQTNPHFALANRLIFSKFPSGARATPVVDTRVFSLTASNLAHLLSELESLDVSLCGVRFERGFYISMLQERRSMKLLIHRGNFWPVFLGQAGHGKNYSQPTVFIMSLIRSLLFRLGL